MLRQNGYFTAMVGKWHLDQEPTDFGFDRYFGHLSGACNFFRGDETFRLNGKKWEVPESGFYTTIANTDFALQFLLEARETNQPWLLYMAFNAPHSPLHCLEEDYNKYRGTYDAGWDSVRNVRFRKQMEMGLLEDHVRLSSRPYYIPPWDSLSGERREMESARMAAYAAMIDRVDQELGRVMDDLEKAGELENTFIMLLSDNGGSPFERHRNGQYSPWNPESGWRAGTAWAWLSNTPFRNYKQNQFEGGITSPAVIYWPAGIQLPAGSVVRDPAHFIDVLPTLADITDSELPGSWPGRELTPVEGISIAPTFAGKSLDVRPLFFLFHRDRAIREGDWKLVSLRGHPWELYNLAKDRTEITDLVDEHPEIALRLSELWYEMAANVDETPLRLRNVLSPAELEKLHPEWSDYSQDAVRKLQAGGKIRSAE
jgi:arylsulfatase